MTPVDESKRGLGRFHRPERIYKRRKLWHWLADAGAPFWLWSRFAPDTWQRCATCGLLGVGRWKPSATFGGGLPPRRYCPRHRHDGGLF